MYWSCRPPTVRAHTATNREEARVVAKAVLNHAKAQPDVTLGVGTFSVRQRDAILDELELLRRTNPETEFFFASDGAEAKKNSVSGFVRRLIIDRDGLCLIGRASHEKVGPGVQQHAEAWILFP